MHTDEYEISLSRELTVCANAIKRIERILDKAHKEHQRESHGPVEKPRNGGPAAARALAASEDSCQALHEWETRKRQYEELLRCMKI